MQMLGPRKSINIVRTSIQSLFDQLAGQLRLAMACLPLVQDCLEFQFGRKRREERMRTVKEESWRSVGNSPSLE